MPATRVYIQSEHFADIKLIEIDSDASVAPERHPNSSTNRHINSPALAVWP